MSEERKRQKVGAAWKNKTKSGKAFLSIAINEDIEKGSKLTMWPNGYKETAKQPDYILYADQGAEKPSGDPDDYADENDIPF